MNYKTFELLEASKPRTPVKGQDSVGSSVLKNSGIQITCQPGVRTHNATWQQKKLIMLGADFLP